MTLVIETVKPKVKTMSVQMVTLTLPQAIYERARETARVADRPLEDVLVQSIVLSLPPLEKSMPPLLRAKLAILPLLSDAELWAVARSTMNNKQQAHLEGLAEAQQRRLLTPTEQSALAQLVSEAERVMLHKAEAYRLLARRGYTVFAPPDTALH
jgi:hypothetical protein